MEKTGTLTMGLVTLCCESAKKIKKIKKYGIKKQKFFSENMKKFYEKTRCFEKSEWTKTQCLQGFSEMSKKK